MKKLNDYEMDNLLVLNPYLLKATGIDFIAQIDKCAENENCTELEVKDFLKKKYPGAESPATLTKDDKLFLSLFLRYYCQKRKEYCRNKESDTVKIAAPHPRPSLEFYDSIVPQGCFKSVFSFGQ